MIGMATSRAAPTMVERGLVQHYLSALEDRLPVLGRVLRHHGQTSLGSYVSSLLQRQAPAIQSRDDFIECVHRRMGRLFGESVGESVARSLVSSPTILTANHHGVDYFAQSVQGTLALALHGLGTQGDERGAVVVLACAAVPLNNLTYPRGLLTYLESRQSSGMQPKKLPLFPDRFKRTLVANAPALSDEMVRRGMEKLARMCSAGDIPAALVPTIHDILSEDYASRDAQDCASYSEQATVINRRLWRRMLAPSGQFPELAYLELEQVTTDLLRKDLVDSASLAWTVLFDSRVREDLLALLDGERGCWDRGALARRNLREPGERPGSGAGTVFFWGLDGAGRRIPLALTSRSCGASDLVGIGDKGETTSIPFRPDSLDQALKESRLLPSLFLSYLCLGMARGVNCVGGYYQSRYLPTMQRAVAEALTRVPGHASASQVLGAFAPDGYLSGMQTVCTRTPAGGLAPAGPLEIIAGGGLDRDDMQKIGALSLRAAHEVSLVETICDAGRDLIEGDEWRTELMKELDSIHRESVVVKEIEAG